MVFWCISWFDKSFQVFGNLSSYGGVWCNFWWPFFRWMNRMVRRYLNESGELMNYGPLIYSGLKERGAIEFVKQVISRGVCGLFGKLVRKTTWWAESIHFFSVSSWSFPCLLFSWQDCVSHSSESLIRHLKSALQNPRKQHVETACLGSTGAVHTDIRNLLPEAPEPDMMIFYSL